MMKAELGDARERARFIPYHSATFLWACGVSRAPRDL